MKLWTWQTSGFNICRDHVVLGKSHFHNHADGIPQKYQRVFKRLGTRDVVWCFTVETDWKSNQTTVDHRVCWTLDVPTDEIASFVDDWLANRLQEGKPCPELETWRNWRRESVQQHPKRIDRQDQFIDAKLKGQAGATLAAEEGWHGIFLDEPEAAEHVSALVRCPIDPKWLSNCPLPKCERGRSCQR
ncbi:MAG: hypothetical protein JWL69_3038 [Phycisphaerales bacterium]|nr:hypothetical protein [Phycisphaerales bacterium]MDB5353572.1 hypothetical protein [Phycisphaerales bacterium]